VVGGVNVELLALEFVIVIYNKLARQEFTRYSEFFGRSKQVKGPENLARAKFVVWRVMTVAEKL